MCLISGLHGQTTKAPQGALEGGITASLGREEPGIASGLKGLHGGDFECWVSQLQLPLPSVITPRPAGLYGYVLGGFQSGKLLSLIEKLGHPIPVEAEVFNDPAKVSPVLAGETDGLAVDGEVNRVGLGGLRGLEVVLEAVGGGEKELTDHGMLLSGKDVEKETGSVGLDAGKPLSLD